MNHFNEISYLSKICNPDYAIITNIGTAHIGNLGSKKNILKAKLEILDGMSNKNIIVNNKDKYLKKIRNAIKDDEKRLNVIYKNENEFIIDNVIFNYKYKHILPDIFIAIKVGLLFDINLKLISEAISEFEPIDGRLNIINREYKIIDDSYNSSYESLIEGLKSLDNNFKYMFSPGFIKWCQGKTDGCSIGNGALMRLSPVGYLFNNEKDVLEESIKATKPSHNSALALEASKIMTKIIFKARQGVSKEILKQQFCPEFTLEDLQKTNTFDSTCLVLDKCLYILFSSNSFEEAIRNAVSIGGDTDTVAAITGSMAEALYGIDDNIKDIAFAKLPKSFQQDLTKGYQKIKNIDRGK